VRRGGGQGEVFIAGNESSISRQLRLREGRGQRPGGSGTGVGGSSSMVKEVTEGHGDASAAGGGGYGRWKEGAWARVGRKVVGPDRATRPSGPKSKENPFGILIRILEFCKTLKIDSRRIRGNLDMGIFPKIF
jgi:hypothetical protein